MPKTVNSGKSRNNECLLILFSCIFFLNMSVCYAFLSFGTSLVILVDCWCVFLWKILHTFIRLFSLTMVFNLFFVTRSSSVGSLPAKKRTCFGSHHHVITRIVWVENGIKSRRFERLEDICLILKTYGIKKSFINLNCILNLSDQHLCTYNIHFIDKSKVR